MLVGGRVIASNRTLVNRNLDCHQFPGSPKKMTHSHISSSKAFICSSTLAKKKKNKRCPVVIDSSCKPTGENTNGRKGRHRQRRIFTPRPDPWRWPQALGRWEAAGGRLPRRNPTAECASQMPRTKMGGWAKQKTRSRAGLAPLAFVASSVFSPFPQPATRMCAGERLRLF